MTPRTPDTQNEPPEPHETANDRMSDAVPGPLPTLPTFDPRTAGPAPRDVEPSRGYTMAAFAGMFAFADLIARAALQVQADRAREGLV